MIARISPRRLRGTVAAIPSKSEAHRSLICAALADAPTRIVMGEGSEDISATIRCLTAFGAKIERTDFGLRVEPIAEPPVACDADCGESGSTLRFLLPVAAALGVDARFHMRGRLPDRPIAPLDRELTRGGCEITRPERDVLRIRGKLRPGEYELPGDVSSQYISGLLFALPLLDGESRLTVTGKRESVDYVAMTLQTLARFGVEPEQSGADYIIGRNHSDRSLENTGVGGRLDAQTPFSGEAFNGGDSNSRDRSRAATCIGENGVNSCDRSLREMCGNGSGSNSCDRSLGESCPDNGANSRNCPRRETCDGDRSNSRSCSLRETCGGDGSNSCDRSLRESCPDNGVNSRNRSLGETCGGNRPNSCDRSLRESCPDNGVNSRNRSLRETCDGDRSNSRSCSLGETCVGGDGSNSCDRTLRESCPDNGGNSRNCPLRETCGDGNRSNSCDRSLGETCGGGDGSSSCDRPPAETHGGGSNSPYRSPGEVRVGGDWSNAAFWLCADALPGCAVNITGLDESSAQGDRRVAEELRRMRAGETVLDAADIPDLVPILAATACARCQALRVIHAGRLRIKESDRLASVSRTLRALGGDVAETEDGLIVAGNIPASEVPFPIDPRIHTDPIHTCDADAYWPGFAEEGAAGKPALHEKALSAIDPNTCDTSARRPDFAEASATDGPELRKKPSSAIDPNTCDTSARRSDFAEDSATDRPELRKIPFSVIDPRTRDAACRPNFAGESATDRPELRKKPYSAIAPRTRDASCRPGSADDSAAGLGETEANSIQQGSPKPRRTVADASACAVHCEAVDAPGFDEAETNSIRQVAHEARLTLADASACALTGGEVDACGDHRIAMMAAIASYACANEVVIRGAEAVNKSYPGFWRDFVALGGCVELTED